MGPTVLYALAAPSTPEEVREEIEGRAAAGEKITVAEVERLKREAKAAQESAARMEAERAGLLARVSDAERYGSKTEIISVLKNEVLLMLAAPSTPEQGDRVRGDSGSRRGMPASRASPT